MTAPFPSTQAFSGHNAPSRVECDIFDLEIEGSLPEEIAGAWYRSIPDPQYPPFLGDDVYISGDGMVSSFRFAGGHVDFRMRYVQTERWKSERAARRSLYGRYRNPYTDDPTVRGKGRGVANTTPFYHGGRLLALKEDARGWELDPETLATIGEWDYSGKLRSQTMTAHPRLDPDTGELYFFGYEAAGLATRDVAYCVANAAGELVREQWFEAPYCALMHDFAVSKQHAVFPCFPIVADLERLRGGGPHWVWQPELGTRVGIMPRAGDVAEMRWFTAPLCSGFHVANAFTAGTRVHLDVSITNVPVFPFIRADSGLRIEQYQLEGAIERWVFDLAGPAECVERRVLAPPGDLPRLADKETMRDYDILYYALYSPDVGPPIMTGAVGAGFNALSRVQVKSGRMSTLPMAPGLTLQEAIHIPSKVAGHEGYLAFVVDLHAQNLSEVYIVAAGSPEQGPLAKIKVPLRLRSGVHGTWVARA
jgi:carotenoid cleavage dioxygenase-like enzyme